MKGCTDALEIDGMGFYAQQSIPEFVRHFSYVRPRSAAEAVERLARAGAMPLGGGTDLLPLLDEGIAQATQLVDVRALPGASEIRPAPGRGLSIGSAARLADIARHARVRRDFPALAQACDVVGTTALRHMGTLGGNLCQRPRCLYFRRNIPCYKSGASTCPAVDGDSRFLAIFGAGLCRAVHPSDPAVALTALDAVVQVLGPSGERRVPIGEFYAGSERQDGETVLRPGEFVVAVELEDGNAGGRQWYEKLMQRGAWDFALASLAAARTERGDVRLVLGGVASAPWTVPASVTEDVASGALDPHDVATLADRALYDARPLAGNDYKLALARTLLERAIAELSAA